MGMIIGMTGLIGFFICLIVLIVRAIRKKSKKIPAILLTVFFVCFVVGIIITPESENVPSNDNSPVSGENHDLSSESSPDVEQSSSKPNTEIEDSEDATAQTNTEENSDFYSGKTNSEPIEDIVSDGIVEKLVSFGFTESEAQDIRKIFVTCGVSSLDGCEPTDPNATIDGLVSFRAVWDKDRTFWFTVDNRKVFYIALNGVDVYDTDKGGYLININDVHVPVSDVSVETFYKLQDLAMAAVDGYLKYPNSAYYDAWAVARSDDKYMIQGEVQAKNALGVKDWLPFKVWFDNTDGNYDVEGITINGNRVL